MCGSPGSEIESVSPALAGGFFTMEPPGKPRKHLEGIAEQESLHQADEGGPQAEVACQGGFLSRGRSKPAVVPLLEVTSWKYPAANPASVKQVADPEGSS